jgi:HK97 gp10 family phage protein
MAKSRGTKVGIEGGRELAEKFKAIGKQVYTEQEQGVLQAAMIVERDAKINAPVDTGRLRSSITSRIAENDGTTIAAEVGTNVQYAQAVEFGTSRKAARPFMLPAFENNKQKILKQLAKAMKNGCGL